MAINKHQKNSFALTAFVALTYLILYVPIIILIIFSFNHAPFPYAWKGFSLRWYHELFESVEVWDALRNSLIVAFSSVFLSLLLGVSFILYTSRRWLNYLMTLFYGTLAAPEVVLAVALLSLFSFFTVPLGLTTLIAGHTLLGLGYVIPLVYTRFVELDYRLTEASLDLGATQSQTFWYITVPLLFPSLVAAALLVFIISLDDFLISFFCSGSSTLTLPMYIFSVIRSGATPLVNALSTMLLCISSLCVVLFSSLKIKTRMF